MPKSVQAVIPLKSGRLNSSCGQCDGGTLDYRGLNIPKETMLLLVEEITGQRALLGFSENVIKNDELDRYLHFLQQELTFTVTELYGICLYYLFENIAKMMKKNFLCYNISLKSRTGKS